MYRKPTNCNAYSACFQLSSRRHHQSIIYCQVLCYSHIYSDPLDRYAQLIALKQGFRRLNNPTNEMNRQICTVRSIPKEDLLKARLQKQNEEDHWSSHSSQFKPFKHAINKLQSILDKDTALSQVLGSKSIFSYKQPPNLEQILTRKENNKTVMFTWEPDLEANPDVQLVPIYTNSTITDPNYFMQKIHTFFCHHLTAMLLWMLCRTNRPIFGQKN